MGQPKRLTEDQQAAARKAYPLATTEVERFVRRNHPLVWEHALKEAFVLLGAQPPTIVAKGSEVEDAPNPACRGGCFPDQKCSQPKCPAWLPPECLPEECPPPK